MLFSDHLAREGSFSNRYCLLKRIRNQKILLSSKSLWNLIIIKEFMGSLSSLFGLFSHIFMSLRELLLGWNGSFFGIRTRRLSSLAPLGIILSI